VVRLAGGRLAVHWLTVRLVSSGRLANAKLAGEPPAVREGAEADQGRPAADPEQQPVLQACRAAARRNAPAAERPAVSHAPWAATGGISRIFMTLLECVSDKFAFPSGTPPKARGVPG